MAIFYEENGSGPAPMDIDEDYFSDNNDDDGTYLNIQARWLADNFCCIVDDDDEPRPVKEEKPKPALLGLLKVQKKKVVITKRLRHSVWIRWIGIKYGEAECWCCREIKISQGGSYHCGHVKAESLGGETDVENLRPICADCNLGMRTKNMIVFQEENGFDKREWKYNT